MTKKTEVVETEVVEAENLKKDLTLVEVDIENGQARLTFYDETSQEIREVSLRKVKYNNDKQKYEDNEEQAEKAEEIAQDIFGLAFKDLEQAVGVKKDIYTYEKFNSFYFIEIVNKFDLEDEGDIFTTPIIEVKDDGQAIQIKFQRDGKKYASKMGYSKYLEVTKTFVVDPVRRDRQYKNFADKFNTDIKEADSLVGTEITVEVKVMKNASGAYPYAEIKKLKAKK